MQSPVLRRAGVFTWLIFALCLVFTLLIRAGAKREMLAYFVFYPPLMAEGEIWRLITPTFLHFSFYGSVIIHLLFNSLIWLNLGGWIEYCEKAWRLPLLFLSTALISNAAAYFSYGVAFGGLSGVAYGLIGYLWWAGRRVVLYRMILPTKMFYTFLAFLALGYTGLIGNIANSAHLGGLIAGIAFAALLPPRFKPLTAAQD